MCAAAVEGCVYSASQQLEYWYVPVFSSCECGDVWIFYRTIAVWIFSWTFFRTVSEHKKLTMLAVCILIDIVHATPYAPTSAFHIWRVMVSHLLSAWNCFFLIFFQLCLLVCRGHQSCLSRISSEQISYLIVQIVRRYMSGASVSAKSWNLIIFFQFSTTVWP